MTAPSAPSRLSTELAAALKAAGLRWVPASGDQFVLPDRDLDHLVFVLSDMTVDVQDVPSGRVIGFNGTVEWALDSVEIDEALWLPREDALRELLGEAFRSLRRTSDGYAVTAETSDGVARVGVAASAVDAYARALLAVGVPPARPGG
ncbi:MAG: hypothetical protein R2737_00785 [Candidatus Nanopelagicales bacterium]